MGIRVTGIDSAIADLDSQIERGIRIYALEVYRIITFLTPVDTGHARANWFVDFGRSVDREVNSAATMPSTGHVQTWTLRDGQIIIHNSVHYIIYLDDGSSGQAPQGITGPAVAQARGLNINA